MSALGGLGRRISPLAPRGAPARGRFKLAGLRWGRILRRDGRENCEAGVLSTCEPGEAAEPAVLAWLPNILSKRRRAPRCLHVLAF